MHIFRYLFILSIFLSFLPFYLFNNILNIYILLSKCKSRDKKTQAATLNVFYDWSGGGGGGGGGGG